MSTGRVVARATIIVMIMSGLSRLLGLGREAAIAHRFGASSATDAYLVAFTIPNIFYGVAGLALATVIVPIFAEYVAKGQRADAWRLCSLITNALVVFTVGATLLGMLAAPLIVGLLGHGFPPETFALAVRLTMFMLPSIVFFSLAGLFMGILNANNIFGVPAFGSAAMNIVIIIGALFLSRFYGVYGLAAGALGGAFTMALIQVPVLKRAGFRYHFALDFRHPEVRRVLRLVFPLTLGLAVNQIYLMVDWVLASGLAEGSIAALNYANKLIQLPQSVFVLAISTAIFPTLSKQIAEAKPAEMAATLRRGIKVVLMLAIPGGAGILILREPIVTLLFQRGAFDARATEMTSAALLFFAIGLIGLCMVMILSRGFFAMQDTRTPVAVTLGTLVVKFGASFALMGYFAHAGLALGTSITALLNMFILTCLLHRRLPVLTADMARFFGGTVLATAAMTAAVYFADAALAGVFTGTGTALLARITLDVVVGILTFFAAGILLRLDELVNIVRLGRSVLGAKIIAFRVRD